MSIANPLRGAPRIHGELLKLGIDIGQTSVATWPSEETRRAKGIVVTINSTSNDGTPTQTITIPWASKKLSRTDTSTLPADREPDQKLLRAVVRAHAWLSDPANDRFSSIEELASKADIHPKVMREALKLAFLAPDIVTSIFAGEAAFELTDLRKVSALSWQSQRKELHRVEITAAFELNLLTP
jgi:hypothetical protein